MREGWGLSTRSTHGLQLPGHVLCLEERPHGLPPRAAYSLSLHLGAGDHCRDRPFSDRPLHVDTRRPLAVADALHRHQGSDDSIAEYRLHASQASRAYRCTRRDPDGDRYLLRPARGHGSHGHCRVAAVFCRGCDPPGDDAHRRLRHQGAARAESDYGEVSPMVGHEGCPSGSAQGGADDLVCDVSDVSFGLRRVDLALCREQARSLRVPRSPTPCHGRSSAAWWWHFPCPGSSTGSAPIDSCRSFAS